MDCGRNDLTSWLQFIERGNCGWDENNRTPSYKEQCCTVKFAILPSRNLSAVLSLFRFLERICCASLRQVTKAPE